ncbi:MAG TPA: hypothetical protein VEP90_18530 [Methylomirabilota bacterium]|nr:hypothetical protein [Methylomirabilota bacterium]
MHISFRSWERMLDVLSIIEEVAQHIGSSSATNTWLLTLVSSGCGSMFHPLTTPSSRLHRARSPKERDAMGEQLRPRAWRDENDNASD